MTKHIVHKYTRIHSIGMCRMRWFRAVLRSLFQSSLSYTFPCHSSPPTMLPSSLTSSCHLFHGLPRCLVASNFILNTLLGILFSFILCTCPNQRNRCNLIVSVIAGFLTIVYISLLVNKIYTLLTKIFNHTFSKSLLKKKKAGPCNWTFWGTCWHAQNVHQRTLF
jgi:hypothetical protein